MFIHNNMDRKIKTNLFVDILNIVGISPYSRKTNKSFYTQIKTIYNNYDNINNALCELKRPKGGFELIFPRKESLNKYKKFFISNNKENIKFWENFFT